MARVWVYSEAEPRAFASRSDVGCERRVMPRL